MNPQLLKLVQNMFPGAVVIDQSSCFEVNGLEANVEPQNCTVVVKGEEKHSRGDRRTHYVVKIKLDPTGERYLPSHLRICKADSSSSYAEYAVVKFPSSFSAEERAYFEKRSLETLEVLTEPEIKLNPQELTLSESTKADLREILEAARG